MQTGRKVPPVVGSPRLAKMTEEAPRPTPVGGKTLLMPAAPKPDTARTGRMAPFKAVGIAAIRQPKVRPEMEARKLVTEQVPKNDGYVRLQLRVSGEKVSVVGARAVEGPLVQESKLDGDLVYEAVLDGRRVSVGSIPDAGVKRSFPAPDGRGEMQGHFVTELESFDVAVRLPASDVSLSALPKLDIALYRLKEELPRQSLDERPLAEQFGRELREVGRIKGIRPDRLDESFRLELKKALG
jgi:hypothetical protein